MSQDDIPQMIEDCMNRKTKLNEWEREFIESVNDSYGDYGSLTERQKETLDKIWEKVT